MIYIACTFFLLCSGFILVRRNVLTILLLLEGLFLSCFILMVSQGYLGPSTWSIFFPLVWAVVGASIGLRLAVRLSRSTNNSIIIFLGK